MGKLGRNNPCPCGSGKKYKKCCFPRDEATLRAAGSYQDPEDVQVDPDDLQERLRRMSDSERAGLVGLSAAEFVRFSNLYVKPTLLDRKGLSELHLALRALFFRLHMQMQSLALLVAAPHYAAVMMISRNMLELCLDLFVLAQYPEMLGKYLAFPEVDRFAFATKLLTFYDRNSSLEMEDHQHAITVASDPQRVTDIEQVCIRHWGTNKNGDPVRPQSWSNLSIADLASKAGPEFEESYRTTYKPSSWWVHGGPVGHVDLPPDAYCKIHVAGHLNAQEIFERSIRKMDEIFELSKEQSHFYTDLERVKWQYGKKIFDAAMAKDGLIRTKPQVAPRL
jgi:hypothetical protein